MDSSTIIRGVTTNVTVRVSYEGGAYHLQRNVSADFLMALTFRVDIKSNVDTI